MGANTQYLGVFLSYVLSTDSTASTDLIDWKCSFQAASRASWADAAASDQSQSTLLVFDYLVTHSRGYGSTRTVQPVKGDAYVLPQQEPIPRSSESLQATLYGYSNVKLLVLCKFLDYRAVKFLRFMQFMQLCNTDSYPYNWTGRSVIMGQVS